MVLYSSTSTNYRGQESGPPTIVPVLVPRILETQRRKHKANESLKTCLSSVGLPTEQECTEGSFLVGNARTSERSRTLQCHCTSFCTFHQTGALFVFVTCDEVIVRWNVAEQCGESLYGDRRQRAHSRRSHEEGDATPKFVASGHLCYCAP